MYIRAYTEDMKSQYITATEARKTFFELLEKVKKSVSPVNITIKGIPEVVMLSKDEYDGLIATLETYEDPELMEAIREGQENIKNGEYRDWEVIKREMLGEHLIVADKGKMQYVPGKSRKTSRKTT